MKQVILVRSDINIPRGKLAAQCAHASVESGELSNRKKFEKWREEGMKKIVLKVEDLNALFKYEKLAQKADLTTAMITDAGRTVFKEPTITCLAIGPDADEKINKITGKLKVLL